MDIRCCGSGQPEALVRCVSVSPSALPTSRIALREGRRAIGVDLVPERLRRAEANGITTVDLRAHHRELGDVVRGLTGGRGADSVIDAVGMEAHGTGPGYLYDKTLQTLRLVTDRGQALRQALGDKRGIRRYGDALSPMDECLTRVALDISGRPWLVWKTQFTQTQLGTWDTELIEHWFHSFAQAAGITLHVETLYGHNNHHIVESAYKGLARALRQAVEIDPRKADAIPSTKGVL